MSTRQQRPYWRVDAGTLQFSYGITYNRGLKQYLLDVQLWPPQTHPSLQVHFLWSSGIVTKGILTAIYIPVNIYKENIIFCSVTPLTGLQYLTIETKHPIPAHALHLIITGTAASEISVSLPTWFLWGGKRDRNSLFFTQKHHFCCLNLIQMIAHYRNQYSAIPLSPLFFRQHPETSKAC